MLIEQCCAHCGQTFAYDKAGPGRLRKHCSDKCRNDAAYKTRLTIRGNSAPARCFDCGAATHHRRCVRCTECARANNLRRALASYKRRAKSAATCVDCASSFLRRSKTSVRCDCCRAKHELALRRRRERGRYRFLTDEQKAKKRKAVAESHRRHGARRSEYRPRDPARSIASAYRAHLRRGYRLKPARIVGHDPLAQWERTVKGRVKTCPACGACWCPLYGWGRSQACSLQCSVDLAADGDKKSKDRRRARIKASKVHSVSRLKVFARDAWTCQACGCATPRHLMGSRDDNAPELDHIVPLAAGGAHTYDNTQCLCRICNLLKADRPMDAFMNQWLTGGRVHARAFALKTAADQPRGYFPPNEL